MGDFFGRIGSSSSSKLMGESPESELLFIMVESISLSLFAFSFAQSNPQAIQRYGTLLVRLLARGCTRLSEAVLMRSGSADDDNAQGVSI